MPNIGSSLKPEVSSLAENLLDSEFAQGQRTHDNLNLAVDDLIHLVGQLELVEKEQALNLQNFLSAVIPKLPLVDLGHLWHKGAESTRSFLRGQLEMREDINYVRTIIYSEKDPEVIFLRETSSENLGLLGGGIRRKESGPLETYSACAVREAEEEGDFQDLKDQILEPLLLLAVNGNGKSRLKGIDSASAVGKIKENAKNPEEAITLIYAISTEAKLRTRKCEGRKVKPVKLAKFFGEEATKNPGEYLRPSHIDILRWWHSFNEDRSNIPIVIKASPSS